MTNQTKRGRPRKGSLYWTKSGWRARATINVDGVAVQKSFNLETRDKQVARIKLRRLVQTNGAPSELQVEAARTETTAEAIRRIVAQQGREGLKTWNERLARLERYAVPEIGRLPVDEVRPGDIRDLLERAGETLSKQSVTHVRNDLGTVFGALWRDEMIPENPVRRVKLPKGTNAAGRLSQLPACLQHGARGRRPERPASDGARRPSRCAHAHAVRGPRAARGAPGAGGGAPERSFCIAGAETPDRHPRRERRSRGNDR